VKFAFIADQADMKVFPVEYMCRMLGVTRQGFYQWKKRGASRHDRDDATLASKIRVIFEHHKRRYGVRRVHAELLASGVRVAYKRVQRLMRELGLVSVHPRPWKRTTVPAAQPAALPDLVGRRFDAEAPDQLWYGDITYVKTWDGWAYIASVVDAFSRKAIGWAVADHMRTGLVIEALRMALVQRQPAEGVIFHADRGSQYTSAEFVGFCSKNGVRNSVGRTGICYDNAAAESFWATLKKEYIHLRPFDTVAKLRSGTFEYIEGYYNTQRRHSTLGYLTPLEYENRFHDQGNVAA
jgi:transposase InsO family protein